MIATQAFGRTGHLSSRVIFGGWALHSAGPDEAARALDLLLQHGVNHIDTSINYGDSELRLGPWMKHHRQAFFLATKTDQRTRGGANEQLQRSLELLQTDYLDLWQFHTLTDPGEWETTFGPGGALEAAVEARDQGLVRFIGVTGHGVTAPAMHRRSLERFDLDSVLLPYNYMMMQNPAYAADFEALAALCAARNAAMQTIKGLARGPWGARPRHGNTWYEPLEEQADVDRAVHWVLGRPAAFLNSAGDLAILPRILDAAERFEQRPAEEEMRRMAARLEMAPLFT